MINLLNDNFKAFSEPFSDFSSIPTLFLAEFSSKDVTVALSGDGGDELFGDILETIKLKIILIGLLHQSLKNQLGGYSKKVFLKKKDLYQKRNSFIKISMNIIIILCLYLVELIGYPN